jgi:hypothetical protein
VGRIQAVRRVRIALEKRSVEIPLKLTGGLRPAPQGGAAMGLLVERTAQLDTALLQFRQLGNPDLPPERGFQQENGKK